MPEISHQLKVFLATLTFIQNLFKKLGQVLKQPIFRSQHASLWEYLTIQW